jgi:hypothetical protein
VGDEVIVESEFETKTDNISLEETFTGVIDSVCQGGFTVCFVGQFGS